MQHNKNSDANVGIRCEAQATKRGGKRNWKSPRVGYREGKKDLKKCGTKCKKTLDFLGKVGYNNKRRLKRLKHVRP